MLHFRNILVGLLTSMAAVAIGLGTLAREPRIGYGPVGHDRATADQPTATRSGTMAPRSGTSPNVLVRFQDGLLTVRTRGAPLKEVLSAISESAGVTFAASGEIREDVAIDLGPRPLREVVSQVLEQASYGYALVDSASGTGPATVTQVILVKRGGAGDSPGPSSMQQQASAVSVWPVASQADTRLPPPDEGALKQQRAVDAMFSTCKAQACDTS